MYFLLHIYCKINVLFVKQNIDYWFHPKSMSNFSLIFSHVYPGRNAPNMNPDKNIPDHLAVKRNLEINLV